MCVCVVCAFFFYKGKKKWRFVWKRQTFISHYLSMGYQASVGVLYGYIQSYDPQRPCLLYAVDHTSSTKLLWESNKIMTGNRNISKSRIAIIFHMMFIIFKKWCSGWELRHWHTMGLGLNLDSIDSVTERKLCKLCNCCFSSVKWGNNSPYLVRFQ